MMQRLFMRTMGLWLSLQATGFAATLNALDLQTQAHKTVLTFSLQGSVNYHAFTLTHPYRVAIDFKNTTLNPSLKLNALSAPLIHKIRRGTPYPHVLRLVFDLTQSVQMHTEPLYHGLRIELSPVSKLSLSRVRRLAPPKALLKTPAKPAPIIAKHAPTATPRLIKIVLDPGHGGKDPGAKGPQGTYEKDIVLTIAKRLQSMINAQPGMKAILTRQGDHYLSLRTRLQKARQQAADVFVSIHADAFRHKKSTGASVFALSQRGATSEAARWLAEKENNSELGGINLSELEDKTGLVRTVLLDLSQTATVSASLQIGKGVLTEMGAMMPLHATHVEQARFVVLKSPDIPSILVETGFISNPSEETHLRTEEYQTRLTTAILKGLKRYFWENPPPGTLIERQVARQARATSP